MNILQVIPYFSPSYAFGGPATVAYQISRELVKRGHDVTVYTTDARNEATRLHCENPSMLNGVKVYYFRNISMMPIRWSNLFVTPEMLLRTKDRVKTFNAVHLHEYRTLQNIFVYFHIRKHGWPYVLQAHGSLPRILRKKLKWSYDTLFGQRLLCNASKVIALSSMEVSQYKCMGLPEDKIDVIPNGIDLSKYTDLSPKGSFKTKFGIEPNRKIVLYLGRVHETKRMDLLVRACAYLKHSMMCEDITLVIAGPDSGYIGKVESLAGSLGMSDSLLVTGFLSNEAKIMALADADVFVTPSFHGFPITFLEACATGTPIITTTLGDALEWIDENAGYVTSPNHIDLARAIHRLISDKKLHAHLSRNCKEIVRSRFSIEKTVDKLEKLYEEIGS
jgi:glycosyltransferase involved in cell wall biosynthesis